MKGMWYLKYKYKHNDCIYSPKISELGISVFFYHIGYYVKGNFIYTSAIQQLNGEEKNIKKYISYIKNHNQITNCEIYGNTILTLAKHRKNLKIYESVYNPALIYPSPAYLSKEGFEIIELASWERKPLEEVIKTMKTGKNTTYFELLHFHKKDLEDVYVSRLLPKMPKQQEKSIKIAFENGYYNLPRKTNLDKLAKIAGVSKQTFRENLRKAEFKILPKLISG